MNPMESREKSARDEGYSDGWFDALEGRTQQRTQEDEIFGSGRDLHAYRAGYELGFMTGRHHRRTLPLTVSGSVRLHRMQNDDQDFERD